MTKKIILTKDPITGKAPKAKTKITLKDYKTVTVADSEHLMQQLLNIMQNAEIKDFENIQIQPQIFITRLPPKRKTDKASYGISLIPFDSEKKTPIISLILHINAYSYAVYQQLLTVFQNPMLVKIVNAVNGINTEVKAYNEAHKTTPKAEVETDDADES